MISLPFVHTYMFSHQDIAINELRRCVFRKSFLRTVRKLIGDDDVPHVFRELIRNKH